MTSTRLGRPSHRRAAFALAGALLAAGCGGGGDDAVEITFRVVVFDAADLSAESSFWASWRSERRC